MPERFFYSCNVTALQSNMTVREFWESEQHPAAFTKTPSSKDDGLTTFLDPAQINLDTGNTSPAKQNQATLFHEALHGLTGLVDTSLPPAVSLQGVFGICLDDPSVSITKYLAYNIFGIGAAPQQKSGSTCMTWQ